MNKRFQQSWKDKRGRGFRRCVYRILYSHPGRQASGATLKRKGERCRNFVAPDDVLRLGLPICSSHEKVWVRETKLDAEVRRELRRKYDPGPLPLDEEDK